METVGPHDEQIVGGLHRQEAHAIDLYADGTLEQADGCAHRGLQLQDGRRGCVGRIDGLVIKDHRQRQYAVMLGEH